MNDQKGKNTPVLVITFLSIILVIILIGHLNLKNESPNLNKDENNTQVNTKLLSDTEALKLGKVLYKYANNVGSCQEFEYLHNQPGGSIVLNYEEVTSTFTQNYLNLSTNIFSTIKKGEDGKYYDLSVCGFGLSCAKNLLTEFKVMNISENYITFEATVSTISTGCVQEIGIVVRTDTQTFAIKKENDMWKIDVYVFQYVTEW